MSKNDFELRCKTLIPFNRVILAYFGTALRDFLKNQPWIKHQLSFFSSATLSMMSVLNTFISSIAHKVTFLFLKDFKNDVNFMIKTKIRFKFFQKKIELQMNGKVA